MDTILQSILDVAGVGAALVFDGMGRLVAHRGKSVYDRALCETLGQQLVKAVDTIQLQHEGWESVAAQYADGRLLLRNLGEAAGTTHVLAVVADATLNPSFATVAIRVATQKLQRALAGGASSVTLSAPPPLPGASHPGASQSIPIHAGGSGLLPGESRVNLSSTGTSWGGGSSVGLSRVSAADPASAAFLGRCVKELARHVGPMAKVYVEEAVRRVSPDAAFAMAAAPRLVDDLSGQIEDPDDRAQFRNAIRKH